MEYYLPTKRYCSLLNLKEIGNGLIQAVNRFFSLHYSPLQRENEAKVVLSWRKKLALQSNAGWEGVIRVKKTPLRSDSQLEVTP